MTPGALAIDSGLLGRFRAAGGQIAWREAKAPAGTRPAKGTARIAHLNDEEARVEERREGATSVLTVESGPLGALVLLLRWEEFGEPNRLVAREGGELRSFPSGALEATWSGTADGHALAVPLADVVGLARYALA
jgi:hypothetical protein